MLACMLGCRFWNSYRSRIAARDLSFWEMASKIARSSSVGASSEAAGGAGDGAGGGGDEGASAAGGGLGPCRRRKR